MKLKEGMVINCNTREKAIKFLKECERQGITSASGSPATNLDEINVWKNHKEKTCYRIEKREYRNNLNLEFCDKEYYIHNGFKIIKFDDLFKEKKKMSKCKIYEMPNYVGNEVKKVIINEPCVIVILNSGEKGIAKCCPEDKFSESIGFNIAFNRARIKKCENNAKSYEHLINTMSKLTLPPYIKN